MFEKCMANCMANKIYIQLRNKIFYYRVELPRVNNKRRYKIISLHTKDYFEAKERIKQMVALEEKFVRLQRLFNNLIFEKADNSDIMTVVSPFDKKDCLNATMLKMYLNYTLYIAVWHKTLKI